MENVQLYCKYNSMQRRYNEEILKEFGPQLSWPTKKEIVLDVGCGPGDVTAEILLPVLPPSASLMGVDINSKMVAYAATKYRSTRIKFKVLDFSTKAVTDVFREKQFSKIFSFFCLHWVKDQEQFAKNVFTLLRPGGEFLIVAALTDDVFMTYKILSQMKQWTKYMKDVEDVIPRVYNSINPCKDMETLLNTQGLEVITCEEREHEVFFTSMGDLLRSYEAVNPFVKRMDPAIRGQFMADYRRVIEEIELTTENVTGEVLRKNRTFIIHGRRFHSDGVNSNEKN